MSSLLKVGITHGDVNGIGYEVLLKAFSDDRLLELFRPVIYGSSKSASYYRKMMEGDPVNFHIISKAEESQDGKINLVNCVKEEIRIEPGTPSAEAGESAYIALDQATTDLANSKIDLLVTLPINKESIQQEKFQFPGHTEFLEDRFANEGEKALDSCYGSNACGIGNNSHTHMQSAFKTFQRTHSGKTVYTRSFAKTRFPTGEPAYCRIGFESLMLVKMVYWVGRK